MDTIGPDNTTLVVLSFKGSAPYALAGERGTRVTELSGSLAEAGYETHALFVGDPHAPGVETRCDLRHSSRCAKERFGPGRR